MKKLIPYAVTLPHDEYDERLGESIEDDIRGKVFCADCNSMVDEQYGCCDECGIELEKTP